MVRFSFEINTSSGSSGRYVTPSGIFTNEHIHFIRDVIGIERILFSVDFPLVPNESARAFLEGADVTPEERELIAHGNSERLLKMAAL